ncbi:thiamine pyrophosphate-binding protein [Actinoplanes sp. NPDC048988]|uniref:thiamine pyrophosphate-binding protein n=1 Tax=Actinoplanes sp. NPDC048988 TaxID=3363901 RepID=UPI0037224039
MTDDAARAPIESWGKQVTGWNMMTTAAHRLVEVLEAQGVERVFGVPGAKIDALYDALVDGGAS